MARSNDLFATSEFLYQIGIGGTGVRTLRFKNAFSGDVTWNPTANRSIVLPDKSGTFVLDSDKGIASGVASLDSSTLIPGAQMGSNFSSITVGEEQYWFLDGSRQWRDRSTITLPEKTSVTTPAADQIRIYASDENGISVPKYIDSTGFIARLMQDGFVPVRNSTGATLTKGTVVYSNGAFAGSGYVATVAKAQANSRATLPALGMVPVDIPNNSFGVIITEGRIDGIDTATSGAVDGQRVLVSATTAGAFTATTPTLPNHAQRLGIVIRSHATQGSIFIDPQAVITGSSGTDNNTFSIGDAAATTKTLRFLTTFNGDLTWLPTAARSIALPDASGTVALLSAMSPTAAVNFNDQQLHNFRSVLNLQTGTTYTVVLADQGKIVDHANASAIAVTLPNSFPVGWSCMYVQSGAGQITYSVASGGSFRQADSYTKNAKQWAGVTLYVRSNSSGTNAEWVAQGYMA